MAEKKLSAQGRAARALWMLVLHESLSIDEIGKAIGLNSNSARLVVNNIADAGIPLHEPATGVVSLRWEASPTMVPDPEPVATPDDELLRGFADVETAAALLGVHPETVRRRIRRDALPAVKVGGQYLISEDVL